MEFLVLQNKFYQTSVGFKGFEEVPQDRIEEFKVSYLEEKPLPNNKKMNLRRYMECLSGFNSATVRTRYKTFDERMLGLIMEMDPNLKMYHLFDSVVSTTKAQISTGMIEAQRAMMEQRKTEIQEVIRLIREQFGFYDAKMLSYEGILYEKFLKKNEFVSETNKDYVDFFLKTSKMVRSFDRMDDEKYKEILNKVQYWETATHASGNAKVAAYSLVRQNDILNLLSVKEQMLFFILAVDPELKSLRIYEEESTKQNIKKRMLDEFGFFHEDLIRVENLYHQRFCPEVKVSAWSL